MIVKIFRASASFRGVRYNTNKIDKDKGELMKVANFGPLQGLAELRPEDYINYLEMISAQNKRIVYPQFHAAISAKGRSFDKHSLTRIAEDWLKEMGYKDQPYLIVFHKDTQNNHIHLVSTRVDRAGKKINSAYEKNRAIQALNRVVGLNESTKAKQDLARAMSYTFSTKAQFMMILESMGYTVKLKDQQVILIKFGSEQLSFGLRELKNKLEQKENNSKRAAQIAAIIEKYRMTYSTTLEPKIIPLPGGLKKDSKILSSDLADFVNGKFGLNLVFHAQDGKPVYGYTIIDNAHKAVFKGSEIMPLSKLLGTGENHLTQNEGRLQQLKHEQATSPDIPPFPPAVPDTLKGEEQFTDFEKPDASINISISDDIDDEAILGRNRRRKKKARTNTR
jgi:hypothetical protein